MRILSLLIACLCLSVSALAQPGSDFHSNAGTASWISDSGVPMSLGTGGSKSLCLFTNNTSRWCVNSNGDLVGSLTKKIKLGEGTNASMGVATLVGGVATVSTNIVTASSRIFLTIQTAAGIPGVVYKSNVVAGTSFDIVSTSAGDTSTVAWLIVEPG